MCGRMAGWRAPSELALLFDAQPAAGDADLPGPRYNVAPTDQVFAVAGTSGGRRLGTMQWGLIPWWATDPTKGPRPINARVENLLDKPLFAEPLARRRCLVPADGFYEWRRSGTGGKRPYFLAARDGRPLALAALWNTWKGDDGVRLVSVAIITTPANPLVAELHDRMPAILPPAAWDSWLGPGTDAGPVLDWLRPASTDLLDMVPANPRVNAVANEGPDLLVDPGSDLAMPLFG